MANPFAKYVQPQEEANPFAKYAQPEPTPEENPFAKYAVPEVSPTAVPNPLQGAEPATAQTPMQPAQEESGLWELPKGLVRGAYSVAQMVPEFMSRQYALQAGAPEAALSAFDKIDAGEIKSKKDINAFISPRKLPTERTAEEIAQMVQGESTAGQKLHAISLAKDYLAASPEERKALREQISSDIQASLKSFNEQQAKVEEYKKAAEPYKARLENFADISTESPGALISDVGSYVGSKLGEAIPQFGPVLASGYLTRGRGVVPTSVAMELPGAVQDRIDFAAKKLEGETDPTKRASTLAKYVRDTNDVTFTAAVMSGILDGVLGPEAGLAKAMASGALRDQTRKEILKALPKVAAKSGAEEFLTGGMQETVMINAERILGEQGGDAFTKENIIRVVDSALSEAIGGLGISTGVEAGRAAFAKKNLADLDTPEGRAMQGLDTLADEEEAATTTPQARTVDSLTEQEVDGIQRQLYAQLGRPATEQELMGAFDEYIADQNASAGTQPGANISGVPSTTPTAGSAEAAATPNVGGLDAAGLAPVQPTAGEITEPSALDVGVNQTIDAAAQELFDTNPDYDAEDYDAAENKLIQTLRDQGVSGEALKGAYGTFSNRLVELDNQRQQPEGELAPSQKPAFSLPEAGGPRVDSIERFPLGPTSIKPTVVAEDKPLYRETDAIGVDDLLRGDPQFSYAPVFVTDNPDLALGQGENVGATVEFRPNSVSGKVNPKPMPGELTGNEYQADVIAPRAIQSITFANQKIANRLSWFAKRALQQGFTKEALPDGKVKYTRKGAPAAPALSTNQFGRQPGETEEEYRERLLMSPKSKMSPDIVDLLRNNDLTGALQLIAAKFKSGPKIRMFYGDLAERLAALNLPTEVRLGDQRNLTRRSIDGASGPQQVRLFAYLRAKQPWFFDEYFKEYYKDDALESVYIGLLELQKFDFEKILAPVLNEYYDVVRAYKNNMPGISAYGAYYPNFDVLNLNDSVGKSNGMDYHTFLHEATHAATETLLQTPSYLRTPEQNAAIEELRKLYEYSKARIATEEYGLTNLSEFIAEVYTNKKFQDMLKAMPYAPAKGNVLTRFMQAVMRLVGMDNVAGRAMAEAEKLFSAERPLALVPAGPRFMAQGKGKFRYRKGPLTSSWRTAEKFKEKLINSHPTWGSAFKALRDTVWDPAAGQARIALLGALELRHISDISRNKFPQVAAAIRIIEKMIAHRGRIMTEAAAISKDWMEAQKKSLAKSQLLGRLMLEATISGVEVDPTNTAYYDATKLKPQLQAAWDALGPDFQNIYRRVRDFYKKQMQDTIRQMKDRANLINDPEQRQKVIDLINRDFGPDKLKFPYFPLKRFGQYWFQVGSGNTKEFYEFESMGARNRALTRRKNELLAGNAAQRALVDSIEVGNSISTLLSQTSDVSTALNTVNELIDSLPDNFNDLQDEDTIENVIGNVQETLRDEINQLIYTMMPQQSLRKQMISRKAIQGASADMLRVFTNSATRIAYQQARAKYSSEFIANLNNARNYIKDIQATSTPEQREVYRDILHEVELRYKPMLGMEDTSSSAKIAGIASDLITTFMMSAPMSAFLQTIGAFQFAAPQLGGRYGYVKATDRMWENFKDFAGSTVERTLAPLKNGQMFSVRFPSVMESSKLKGLDKLAAQQLIDEEQVNVSQTYDLVGVGARPSELTLSKYEAFKRAAFAPLHQAERFNREIVLLSTFQLEYEKLMSGPKKDHNGVVERDAQGNPVMYQKDATTPDGVAYSTEAYDAALTHAKDVTAITLGETTRQMRPRYFMNALLALPLKFKRYMITAIYSMYRNFDAGFVQPFKKEELEQMRKILEQDKQPPDVIDRKIKEMEAFRKELATEGRKALIGTLVNTGLFTGLAGMPFYSTVFPLIVGMFTSDDDDDEFFDFDNWFRNYMESEFGGYIAGMLAKTGMLPQTAEKVGRRIGESIAVGPATVLTGGSFTERASIDIKSLMFRDARYSPTSRGAMQEAITTAAGPAAGLALNWADAKDLWHQGQYMRAAEKGLPAIFGKPLGAVRLATDDAKTKRGDTLVSDITETEIAMQAIGLTPHRVAKAQRQSIQAVEKVQKIQNKRTDIMNALWMAQSTGDAEGVLDAANKAVEFSTKYPSYAITPQLMQDSFKTRMKQQGLANAVGARVQEKDLPIVLPMLNRGD